MLCRSRLSLAGLTLLALAPLSRAADEPSPTDADADTLDTITVTSELEPGNFAIDHDEIELTQAGDLADLLSNQSGVAVGGGAAVAQKVYVRGFEDTLLNVSVDGAQQPAELYHHQTRVQVEPEFIKSVELDAGAGAATAGPGALTGALHVVTRNAFDLLDPSRNAGALIKTGVGTSGEDERKHVIAAYGRLSDTIGALATWVSHDGDDYADGRGRTVTPTAFDHQRQQLRLTGLFGDHSSDLSFEQLDDTGTYFERPHMTNFNGRFILSDHEMQRETASYNHHYDPASDAIDVQATAYRTRSKYQNHRNTTGDLYGRGEQTSLGADMRNTARWNTLALVTGADFREDSLQARQQAVPPPYWNDTDQRVRILGLYAQSDWQPLSALRLSGGIRWDNYHHRVRDGIGAGARNSQARFSPNASIEWQATNQLSLRAAYAQAFRGVTIREAFFSALYVHHGDLQGERADNTELGLSWDHAGWFARATAFRQDIDNYIAAVYTGDSTDEWGSWANIGQADVNGYELEAGKQWSQFGAGLGVWNSDARFDDRPLNDADLGLGTSIGRTWTLRLDWTPGDGGARYGLRARHVESEANSITPSAPDKPGYSVVDVMANWQILAQRQMTIGLSLNNIFDRYYFDHGTYGFHPSGNYIGFPAHGRELNASVSYRF